MKSAIFVCFSVVVFSLAFGQKATKNFHEVEEGKLYRSGQFHRRNISTLQDGYEIGLILNLRNWINDSYEVKGTNIKEYRVRMRAKRIMDSDVIEALKVIVNSSKPVLVHCYHGSDRTGCIVACYRMVVQMWPREEAIAEFEKKELGYNEAFFPNIRNYLEKVDIESLRKAISQ